MGSIVRKLKIALTKITYPIGILIANVPHTIHYGLVQFNPKKQYGVYDTNKITLIACGLIDTQKYLTLHV